MYKNFATRTQKHLFFQDFLQKIEKLLRKYVNYKGQDKGIHSHYMVQAINKTVHLQYLVQKAYNSKYFDYVLAENLEAMHQVLIRYPYMEHAKKIQNNFYTLHRSVQSFFQNHET